MSDTWIDIGGIDEIPQKGSRVVKTTSGDVAVFRTVNDAVFALRDRCPHKGGPAQPGHRAWNVSDLSVAQLGDWTGQWLSAGK